MDNLIVVDDPKTWPLDIVGAEVISARSYLTDPAYRNNGARRVLNLCKSYRYQSLGYYTSLLADARGHTPLPSADTITDLGMRNPVRYLADLDETVQYRLAQVEAESLELHIYFGRDVEKRYGTLGRELFGILRVPLLHACFERREERWRVRRMEPLAASDIPPEHRDFATRAARDYFAGRHPGGRRPTAWRAHLAILCDPLHAEQASNADALRKFEKAAAAVGMHPERITGADFARLPEFDALFIRATTFADHYTYRFARRAEAEGLAVIDDPESILKCNNKVYLAELLAHHNIPVPKTLLVHRRNVGRIVTELGLPCVLKRPDSSFSQGVEKAESEAQLQAQVAALLEKSELIIAQEYLPTDFDWRIGILDRTPIFAAKYFMAPGHWQIIKHGARPDDFIEGRTQAVALYKVPPAALRLALKAANLIGDGLYGVDIKQIGTRFVIIEINDNPNVDAGNEDAVAGELLYRRIMRSFVARIEARRQVRLS